MLMSPAPPTNRPATMMPPTILEYLLRFVFNVVNSHNMTLMKVYVFESLLHQLHFLFFV